MICKACGTECRGTHCPHCGEKLVHETFKVTGAADQAVRQVSVVDTETHTTPHADTANAQPRAASAFGEKVDRAKPKKRRSSARQPRSRVQIKMRQVFFPSLVFFLPLFYLFVDVFVLYSDALYAQTEGSTVLSLLISRLSDAAFFSNPVAEIAAATLGDHTPLIETLTVWQILSAPHAYFSLVAPAVILAASALISALCGVLMLFSAGKLLRYPVVADIAVGGGFFAALAPLLASLAPRLYHVANGGLAAADAAAQSFGISIEMILACGLTLTMMLPAVRAVRRAVGGDGVYLSSSYRAIGCRFGVIRTLGALTALSALVLPLLSLFIEVSRQGTMLEVFFDALEGVEGDLHTLKALFADNFAFLATEALYGMLTLPIVPLMLLSTVTSVFAVLRFLLATPAKLAANPRRCRAFCKTGATLRRASVAMLAFYVLFAIVAFLLLLVGTGLRAHIDLFDINGTLTLLYLLLAYIKTYGTLYTVGILLAALSLLLSTVAGNFARAFVILAKEEYPS